MGKMRDKFCIGLMSNLWLHRRDIDKDELIYAYKIFKLNYEPLISELKNEQFRNKFQDICDTYDEICLSYETFLQLFDTLEPRQLYIFAAPFLHSIPQKVLSMCDRIYNADKDFMSTYLSYMNHEAESVKFSDRKYISKDELECTYKTIKLNYETLMGDLKNKLYGTRFDDICNTYNDICVCYELLIKHFDSLEPQQFYAFAKPFLKSIPEKILSMCKQIYDEQWDFMWLYLVGQDNKEENKAALDIMEDNIQSA